MTDIAALIRDMIEASVDPMLIGRVAAALSEREAVLVQDASADRRREKDRLRKRDVRGIPQMSADSADLSPSKEVPPAPLQETQPHTPPSPPTGAHGSAGFPPGAFEAWYANYPHKVGVGAARKAFEVVRKGGLATMDELVDGVRRYRLEKPPDRPWCNPSTWLNQQRWRDAPASDPTRNLENGRPPPPPSDTFLRRQANLARSFAAAEQVGERYKREH